METGFMNRIIGLVIALVVGGLLVGGLLIPSIEGMTATEKTFENEGIFYAKQLDSSSSDIITWDYTNPTILTVNNEDIDTSAMSSTYTSVTVAFSDKWFVRFALDTTIIYLYEVDTALSSSTDYASPSNEKSFEMVCSSGVATFTIGDQTYTETISGDGLIITKEPAAYVLKKATTAAYVLGDSLVYGAGRTDRALGVSGSSFNAMFKASVEDGVNAIAFSPNTYTVTDSTVTYTEESNTYLDLYKLTAYSISITDGVNSGTVTYNQIFIPAKVTAEHSQHMNPTEIAMFGVISILGIVALVVVAANGIRNKY